jgi:hypothetical protein
MAFPIQRLRRLRQHEAFRRAVDAPDCIGDRQGHQKDRDHRARYRRSRAAVDGADGHGRDWMVNLMCDYFAAYSDNWGDVITDDFHLVMGKRHQQSSSLPKALLALLGNNSHE